MAIRTSQTWTKWSFPVATTNLITGVTGLAATDVFTTLAAHNLAVGDVVVFVATTGGTGMAAGTAYTVATVPLTTTFTLTGVNMTTDLSAATLMLPIQVETTLYAPESAKSWVAATVTLTCDDAATTAVSVTRRHLSLGLGGAAQTTVANTTTLSTTSEQCSPLYSADFVAQFNSNWPVTGGLSKTCQLRMGALQGATGADKGFRNLCATLHLNYTFQSGDTTITGVASTDVITTAVNHSLNVNDYVYIDGLTGGSGLTAGTYTVATVPAANTLTLTGVDFITDITAGTLHFSPVRAKTVPFHLSTPSTSLATSKPSALHTVPVLSTEDSGECPERGKTFRQFFIELLGNTNYSSTPDHTMSLEVASLGTHTTTAYEAGLATARMIRYVTPPSYLASYATGSTNAFYLWASQASTFFHITATLWATYEYNAKTTTVCRVDQFIPVLPSNASMAGAPGSPFVNLDAEFWAPETGVVAKQVAQTWTWSGQSIVTGMVSYILTSAGTTTRSPTSGGGTYAGLLIAQHIVTSNLAVQRGRNRFSSYIYRTGGDPGMGPSGVWTISYICNVPASGVDFVTKGMIKPLVAFGVTATANTGRCTSVVPATMPESATWFMGNWGVAHWLQPQQLYPDAVHLTFHLTVSGNDWGYRSLGTWSGATDEENGWGISYYHATPRAFWPWAGYYYGRPSGVEHPSDPLLSHDFFFVAAQRVAAIQINTHVEALYNYHSQAITISGTIKGSDGGLVEVTLHRAKRISVAGITGSAVTDVFNTQGTPLPALTAGETVIVESTDGAGVTVGAAYTVGTVLNRYAATFSLTGVDITTDITAATFSFPMASIGAIEGEALVQTTRTGDGAFSLTWYDDTEPVFLVARAVSNSNRRHVSAPFLADAGVTHKLRLWNQPGANVIDATIVRKGGR